MNYLDDDRLTFQAMGLFSWMLNHPEIPPTISRLIQASPLGESGVIAICRQLSEIGYVSKTKDRGSSGEWNYQTLVREDLSMPFRLLSVKVDRITPTPVDRVDRKPKTAKERRKWNRAACNADQNYVLVRAAYKRMLTDREACGFPVVGNRLGSDEIIHETWMDLVDEGIDEQIASAIVEGIKTYGHINAVERSTQGHCAPIGLYKFLRQRHWESLSEDRQAIDSFVKMGLDPTNPRSIQRHDRQNAIDNAYSWGE